MVEQTIKESNETVVKNGKVSVLDKFIADKVHKARLRRKYSLETLAKKIYMTPETLELYEKGQIRVYACKLYDIAKALKISIDYFFEGAEEIMPEEVKRLMAARQMAAGVIKDKENK